MDLSETVPLAAKRVCLSYRVTPPGAEIRIYVSRESDPIIVVDAGEIWIDVKEQILFIGVSPDSINYDVSVSGYSW